MPDLHSYALISVGDAKTFLSIESPVYDGLLTSLINQATDYIEKKTGRRFKSTDYTDELYDGEDSENLILKNYPVSAVASVEERDTHDNSDDWDALATDEYYIDEDAGILTKTTVWRRGKQNIRVDYTAGYTTIPSDLQYACMMLVSEVFNRRKAAGVKSETLGDHSIVFESVSQSTDRVMEIIDSYRKKTIL